MSQKGNGSGWEGGQEELGGVEGGETMVRMYCKGEELIFNNHTKENMRGFY